MYVKLDLNNQTDRTINDYVRSIPQTPEERGTAKNALACLRQTWEMEHPRPHA